MSSTKEISQHLGLSERRVQGLQAEGGDHEGCGAGRSLRPARRVEN